MGAQRIATAIGMAGVAALLLGVGLPAILPAQQVPEIEMVEPAGDRDDRRTGSPSPAPREDGDAGDDDAPGEDDDADDGPGGQGDDAGGDDDDDGGDEDDGDGDDEADDDGDDRDD